MIEPVTKIIKPYAAGSTSGIELVLEEENIDVVNNTSDVRLTLYIQAHWKGDGSASAPLYLNSYGNTTLSINGTDIKIIENDYLSVPADQNRYVARKGQTAPSTQIVGQISRTIKHEENGAKQISIGSKHEFTGTGTSLLAHEATYNNIALTTIQRNYTITYHENTTDTVSNMPAPQTETYGVNATISSSKPIRSGYSFLGWNTNSDGTGTVYNSGVSYTGNANLDLYAQWVQQVTIDSSLVSIMENNANISSETKDTDTFEQSSKSFTIGITETPSYINDIVIKAYNGNNELQQLTWTLDGRQWTSTSTAQKLTSNNYRFDLLYNNQSILSELYETNFNGKYYSAPTITSFVVERDSAFSKTGTIRAEGIANALNQLTISSAITLSKPSNVTVDLASSKTYDPDNKKWTFLQRITDGLNNNENYQFSLTINDTMGQTKSQTFLLKPATSTMWMGRNTVRVRDNLQTNGIVRIGDDHDGSTNYVDLDYTLRAILNLTYPIGSIYLSLSNQNNDLPWNNIATWELIEQGRYLMSAGDNYKSELTEDSSIVNNKGRGGYIPSTCGSEFKSQENDENASCGLTKVTGENTAGKEFKNRVLVSNERTEPNSPIDINDYRPSYYAVYIWKRTA